MIPWVKLASAPAPDGTELSLWQRGDERVVRAGGADLLGQRPAPVELHLGDRLAP